MINKKNFLVNVCMIAYKHAEFIGLAIEGVLNQKVNFEVELIISDDASQDATNKIVQDYIQLHPNGHWIKYISHSENKGMMGNFLWTLSECRGKYIAICEGDDYWIDENKLQRQADFISANSEYSACYTNVSILSNDGIAASAIAPNFRREYDKYSIFNDKWIPTVSILFKREALPPVFPVEMLKAKQGDVFLWSILAQTGKIAYMDFVSGVYRIHQQGIWSGKTNLEQRSSSLETITYMRSYFKNDSRIEAIINQRIINVLKSLIETSKDMGKYNLMFKYCAQLIRAGFFDGLSFGSMLIAKTLKNKIGRLSLIVTL